MRYLLLIPILYGCAGAPIDDLPDEYWEYEMEGCDVMNGITIIDKEVLCLIPDEVINNERICYALCKPFSDTCPQVDCE